MLTPVTEKTIREEFLARFPRSCELAERAGKVIPRRVTHDARHFEPFPLYMSHAQGSRKWDVDGNEYVDFAGGHGSLLLGHSHPDIVRAIQRQIERGTHLGFSHEQEIRWAELITQLIPCGEKVEFTMSGTEAVMLALRLVRAYTGRNRIIKFQDHFHGWYDEVYTGLSAPFNFPATKGVLEDNLQSVSILPPNDINAVREALASDDVAAVILEPSGARVGRLPINRQFLADLREETAKAGVVLIFDEVITGFRYAPGGAQEYYGVIPDLATLGKIVGGGLPAGAVTGKAEIMQAMEYVADAPPGAPSRVSHTGTYNANPLTAAAAVVMLEHVATGLPNKKANENGANLRKALNEVLDATGISGCVYGECSIFHIHLAPPDRCPKVGEDGLIPADFPLIELMRGKSDMTGHLKRALLLEGVDLLSDHAWVSAAHTGEDVQWTANAFDKALARMLREGIVQKR